MLIYKLRSHIKQITILRKVLEEKVLDRHVVLIKRFAWNCKEFHEIVVNLIKGKGKNQRSTQATTDAMSMVMPKDEE